MIDAAADLARLSEATALHGLAVFFRVGGAMSLLPAFGERSIPQRVRLVVAVAFTLIVAPGVPQISLPEQGIAMIGLIVTETLIGVVFSLALRILVIALQVAGSMAAQSTSLAQLLGNASTEPMPAIGHVLTIGGLCLAVMSGLHVRVAAGLIESYSLFPAGSLMDPAELAEYGVGLVSDCFGLALALAAPFVLAAFIYNLALGAINRAMPQLMVVLVGAPAITGAGLALLALVAPFLLQIWWGSMETALDNPFGGR